jgi:hypothetical protein
MEQIINPIIKLLEEWFSLKIQLEHIKTLQNTWKSNVQYNDEADRLTKLYNNKVKELSDMFDSFKK